MSRTGNQGQGGSAFRELLQSIPAMVDELGPLEFVFAEDPPPHVGKLVATLGVSIVVDPNDRRAPYVRRAA